MDFYKLFEDVAWLMKKVKYLLGQVGGGAFVLSSSKGQPNGVATLDGSGTLPVSQLPISALEYKGTWNASTNTPTLQDGTGTTGDIYIVSVDGTQDLGGGSVNYTEGQWLLYDGAIWQVTSGGGVGTVASVNGQTGIVVLDTDDVSDTTATNKYFTNALARGAFSAGSGLQFDSGTGVFSNTGVLSVNGSGGAISNVWQQGGNDFGVANNIFGTWNASSSLIFMTSGINRSRITDIGEFVFGTTTSTSGYGFQIKGNDNLPVLVSQQFNAASGTQTAFEFNPVFAQSGTAGYTGMLLNMTESTTGSGAKYIVRGQVGGSDVFRMRSTGLIEGAGIANLTTSSNALIGVGSSGVTLSRNIADSSPAVVVTQTNASSTGDIQRWANSGGTVAHITQAGKMVVPTFQMTTGASNGYHMITDASGNASWAAVSPQNFNTTLTAGNIATELNAIIENATSGQIGYKVQASGVDKAVLVVRNGDGRLQLTTADGVSIIDLFGTNISTSDGTNSSLLSPTEFYLQDIAYVAGNPGTIAVLGDLPMGGVATFSGDGLSVSFEILHGLPDQPSSISVTAGSPDASALHWVNNVDPTKITVRFAVAPPSNTDNVVLYWTAGK